MATTLSEAQAAQAAALTAAFKRQQNRDAARVAAIVMLYYMQRVNVEDSQSVERWLEIVIPRIIDASDRGARESSEFYGALRRIEVPQAPPFAATPALGMVDPGVRKSLMAVGPGDYMNKARLISRSDVSPLQKQALLAEAKQVTGAKLAAAAIRHAQAGGRQTIYESAERDEVALGWVRVTRAKPCAFCAMLASRGVKYRAFTEGAFDMSDARFTGDGDAKVHDNCGCSLKPVYAENDPLVKQTEKFAEMWSEWGAGGGDAALRFRRGYDHWAATGVKLDWDAVNEGLRGA